MKILTVLGARPQFNKAAAVSRAIQQRNERGLDALREVIVHTGQHFDDNMSQVFFDQVGGEAVVTGGNGGNYGSTGGLSGGAAGFAVRKNGHTVPVTNNGTMTGTVG